MIFRRNQNRPGKTRVWKPPNANVFTNRSAIGAISATGGIGPTAGYLNRFNRKEFVTTNTEENAIAIPANIGLSSPLAATGINKTL
ncbi:hypothetical protein CAQUA_03970 [Corynebacterium aquatimens]|nr:hypothetical protein CAQUA_03970 [Corynebacterium aquatimens]